MEQAIITKDEVYNLHNSIYEIKVLSGKYPELKDVAKKLENGVGMNHLLQQTFGDIVF